MYNLPLRCNTLICSGLQCLDIFGELRYLIIISAREDWEVFSLVVIIHVINRCEMHSISLELHEMVKSASEAFLCVGNCTSIGQSPAARSYVVRCLSCSLALAWGKIRELSMFRGLWRLKWWKLGKKLSWNSVRAFRHHCCYGCHQLWLTSVYDSVTGSQAVQMKTELCVQ